MTKREAASLACKIIAVNFFILMATNSIGGLKYEGPNTLSIVLISIVTIVIPLILWLLADRLSSAMIKIDGPLAQDPSHKETDWYSLAVSVLGFLVLFRAIPDLSNVITYGMGQLFPDLFGIYGQEWRSVLNNLVALPIYIILGLWLILGSRGLVEMLKKKSQPVS